MSRNAAQVAMAHVADGIVLLDEATGTFYHLNPAGALAYTLFRTGGCSIAEIASALTSTFQTDDDTARADVEVFADDLARHRLVLR